jgi:hypothetical protein
VLISDPDVTASPNWKRWFALRTSFSSIDTHIVMTLLFRSWSALAGALVTLLIPLFLEKEEQGVFYTLLSLVAVQVFFELGLNQIIVQMVGSEVAHLHRDGVGGYTGDAQRLQRLAAQAALFRRWYLVASVCFLLAAGAGGAMFLADAHPEAIPVWLMLVLFNSVTLCFSPALAILEGCGHVDRIAGLRLMQSVVGYALLLTLLLSGAGIWSVLALSLSGAILSARFVLSQSRELRWLSGRAAPAGVLSWQRDVFPLQWRLAVSWISGYIIMQLFVPVSFASFGSVKAGQIGITMAIFSSIQIIGASWVVARIPVFSGLISTGDWTALKSGFLAAFLRALSFMVLASAAVIIGLMLVPDWLRERFASSAIILALAVNLLINSVIFSLACFMRAHREEPMARVSVALALAVLPVLLFAGRLGMEAMILLYVTANAAIALPWTLVIFRRYWDRAG